jgi:SAM-dependent methyltransferase
MSSQDAGAAVIGPAISLTHEHVLAVLASEAHRTPAGSTVRILDAGCGNGLLMAYLATNLPRLDPERQYEIFGFDVQDHGVQEQGFLEGARRTLADACPSVPWTDRLAVLTQSDPWPWDDGFFDVVVSNQVLEHVGDHARFFAEVYRTLRYGGYSVHLFPLEHYIYEGHLLLPAVHRIRTHELRQAAIRAMSRIGLGKYRAHHRESGVGVDRFSERHADYLWFYTNYLSTRELARIVQRQRLRLSFRYTKDFYGRKLRSLLRRPRGYRYTRQSALMEWWAFICLRYVSSITLFLEKRESYRE